MGETSSGKRDETLTRWWKFFPTKIVPNEYYSIIEFSRGKMTKFPYFPHKCSIQSTNLRIDVNSSNVVQISGRGLSPSFLSCQWCYAEIEIHWTMWLSCELNIINAVRVQVVRTIRGFIILKHLYKIYIIC